MWVFMHIGYEILSNLLNIKSTSRLLKMISLLSNCGLKTMEFKVTNVKNSQRPSIKTSSLTPPLEKVCLSYFVPHQNNNKSFLELGKDFKLNIMRKKTLNKLFKMNK